LLTPPARDCLARSRYSRDLFQFSITLVLEAYYTSMQRSHPATLIILACMVENLVWGAQPYRARHAMVVSGETNATEAGVTVLKHGGNAVDAAVAMAFVLGVTHSGMCGLGGGGYVLLRMADGRTDFFDFREQAPGKASREMFLDDKGNL